LRHPGEHWTRHIAVFPALLRAGSEFGRDLLRIFGAGAVLAKASSRSRSSASKSLAARGRSGQTAGTDFHGHLRKRLGRIPAEVSLAARGESTRPDNFEDRLRNSDSFGRAVSAVRARGLRSLSPKLPNGGHACGVVEAVVSMMPARSVPRSVCGDTPVGWLKRWCA
jgi:hypothetical protein